MNFGGAAENLLPYLKNMKEILDCPANPGNPEDVLVCKMETAQL